MLEFSGPHVVAETAISDDVRQVRVTLREVAAAPGGAGEREAREAYGEVGGGIVIVRVPADRWRESGLQLGDVVRVSASLVDAQKCMPMAESRKTTKEETAASEPSAEGSK